MIDISKLEEQAPLCVCALGIAILGCWGYHVVKWVINKCHKTEKIDSVAQKTIGSASAGEISLTLPQMADSKQAEEVHVDEVALRQKSEKQKTLAATKI